MSKLKKKQKTKPKNKLNAPPKVEELSEAELATILEELEASTLPEETKKFLKHCIDSALWFPHILQNQTVTLSKLRKILFGAGYVKPQKPSDTDSSDTDDSPADNEADSKVGDNTATDENTANDPPSSDTSPKDTEKGKAKGHGGY